MTYKALVYGLRSFGQFLVFPLLNRVLKIPVMVTACLTVASRCGYYLIMCFTKQDMWLYVGAVVNVMAGIQAIIHRSGLSTILPDDEVGSMFALMLIFVALGPITLTTLSTHLFNATLSVNPGLWALIPTGITILQLP